jgi:hypothetical protein
VVVVHRAKEEAKEKGSTSAKGDRAIARKLNSTIAKPFENGVQVIKLCFGDRL